MATACIPTSIKRFRRQLEGHAPTALAERLFEMTEPRVIAFDLGANMAYSGAQVVAFELNLVWGTTYTDLTVRAALDAGFPQ